MHYDIYCSEYYYTITINPCNVNTMANQFCIAHQISLIPKVRLQEGTLSEEKNIKHTPHHY